MRDFNVQLSEEELSKVSAGIDITPTFYDITVVLDLGESAAEALSNMSLPFGLMLDADSIALLNNTIAPDMGTNGPRTLYAKYTISMPYVHVTSYTLS